MRGREDKARAQGDKAPEDALAHLFKPIVIGVDIAPMAVRPSFAEILKQARAASDSIESSAREGRDRTALVGADNFLQVLREHNYLGTKVGALFLYQKALTHLNLGQPKHAVVSLENAVKILNELGSSQTNRSGENPLNQEQIQSWAFNALTPVSKSDVWHVKSQLLRAYSSLALRHSSFAPYVSTLAIQLIREMKGFDKAGEIGRCHADVLSCYALYLVGVAEDKDITHPRDFEKPCKLLGDAYNILKTEKQREDRELLHCGIQLANTFNRAGKVAEGAKILSEVTGEAEKFKLVHVDSLWTRAALCLTLVEQLFEKPRLDGERLKNFRDSVRALGVRVILGEGEIKDRKDVYRLTVNLIKKANEELKKAERIVKDEKRDPLIEWREIQILQQKLRLEALPNDDRAEENCSKIMARINKLRNDRKKAAGNVEDLYIGPSDLNEP